MISRLTKIQLVVFALVTVLAVSYGAVNLLGVGKVFSPPYEIEAQFASSGGIYARADVDLLGTRVGSVKEIKPGPGSGTTVVIAIDKGVEIPADVTALIGSKSAIGEQYIELEPRSSGAPYLADGDVIGIADTSTPVAVEDLLAHTEALAGSIDPKKLTTALTEASDAFGGRGADLGRLIDASDRATRASLDGLSDLNRLIDSAKVALDTQVDLAPATRTALRTAGSVLGTLENLNPVFADVFVSGVKAGTEVTGLLKDLRPALPGLLGNLVTLTEVAAERLPALRKTLAIFPWVLEVNATSFRYCDELDAKTGKPIQSTCRYDAQGRPVYSAHLAVQLPETPGTPAYASCTKGYEGTVKHLPDGTPLKGGPKQSQDSEPNPKAACTASPTDPGQPNIRGSQNVPNP
ncbi:phospholipid/cholesterol/gamma-HCH transport system substrate-binding protein [Marmoricola sp. OAE513]|uniref:MCE family protein n=1 Tax=Marmoricola sp. OAE513 TaxID=2817894 RepID=UPI001AE21B66